MAVILTTDLEKVYDLYADMLYRIALTHSANSHDAMDAVQDVFLKYASENKVFFDEDHKKAWLIRSTVNRCLDLIRKSKVRGYTPIEDAYDLPDEENRVVLQVRDMLKGLPEKFRTVIALHYLEGFSVEEIALILKLSVSAVKMRLSRGRELIKETHKMEDFYGQ